MSASTRVAASRPSGVSGRASIRAGTLRVGCLVSLCLLLGSSAGAATAGDDVAVMARPQVRILSQTLDRTVVRVEFPAQTAPADWQSLDANRVRYALPPMVDDLEDGIGGKSRLLPPRMHLSLAVPTTRPMTVTVTDVVWWRNPDIAVTPDQFIEAGAPAICRTVPLVGALVPLATGGGILSGITIELGHPAESTYRSRFEAVRATGILPDTGQRRESAPAGLLNPDLFKALSVGGRQALKAAATNKAAPAFDAFTATGHWVRLEIGATGLYELTGQQLSALGVPTGDVDPTKLRLYRGGGLHLDPDPTVPDAQQTDRIGLNEVAIDVRDGGDGEWNLDDAILFYGVGTSTWRDRLDPAAGRLTHYDHPFAATAVYWLTWENETTGSPLPGPERRVTTLTAAPTGGDPVNTARLRMHREEQFIDTPGLVEDNWCWATSIFAARTFSFDVRYPVTGTPAQFVADVRGIYESYSSYVFDIEAWVNSERSLGATVSFVRTTQDTTLRVKLEGEAEALANGRNEFTIGNNSAAPQRAVALDSFDLLYWAGLILDPDLGQFAFTHWGDQVSAPGTPVDLLLNVPSGSDPVVWDVTTPAAPAVVSAAPEGGLLTLGLVRDAGTDRHFQATLPGDLMTVIRGDRVFPTSLWAQSVDYDYLVVHATPFTGPALDLAAFHATSLPGYASPAARAVSVDDIYNNFSGGQKDPRAIRNYLRHVYELSGMRLRYVCFLGNASRDFRNYKGRTPLADLYDLTPTDLRSYFPEFPMPLNRPIPFASDDGLVSFDAPPMQVGPRPDLDVPDVAVGRLPALDVDEARRMVDRAIAYSGETEPGTWTNRVLMTSDDVVRPSTYPDPAFGEELHLVEAEYISRVLLPLSLDIIKLYGVDYDFQPPSQVKPDLRTDIGSALSAGTTIFYYVGHGAEDNLADEQIFNTRDIPNLTNGRRRPIFVAFSCDVGVFDSTTLRSMAEEFLLYETGGAIGAICASQVSWTFNNNAIANAFFGNLFPAQHISPSMTVAEALFVGKSTMATYNERANSQRYNLMGDPGMRLPHPVDDLEFAPSSVDTLRAGTRPTAVLAPDGATLQVGAGDGYELRVEESAWDREFVYHPAGYTMTFEKAGGPVFVGNGTLGADTLKVPFKVPSQLRYGEVARTRLLVEAPDGDHTAVQVMPAVRAASGLVDDTQGPEINLAFEDGRYRVRVGQELNATVSDTSGIAILGSSPGNSLLLEFDNTGFMTDVTSEFVYDPDSYTLGRIAYPLPQDMDLGRHHAALHARDSLGNVGSDTLSFEVVAAGVIGIRDVTLFPNPTAGPCRLVFELSDPMAVQWDIYTLAGNRVRSVRRQFPAAGKRILEWDGRDDRGDEIANGTYLFVLRGTGASLDGRELTQTGKLVIMR